MKVAQAWSRNLFLMLVGTTKVGPWSYGAPYKLPIYKCYKEGGPLPVISGVITPISRVISYNPIYPFIRPFRRVIYITPICNDRRGHLVGLFPLKTATNK